jgi:hypothetical protein
MLRPGAKTTVDPSEEITRRINTVVKLNPLGDFELLVDLLSY